MDLCYYFITDQIETKKARVAYCPTDDMIGDFFTKPLQGTKFRKFRDAILNVPGSEDLPLPGEIPMTNFVQITGQECVEACRTGNTGTEARRVGFPDDQEWHQVIGRKKNVLCPKRPITDDRPLSRPKRTK